MASRFEAEKFTGKNDFGLWQMKVRAMLIQQGLAEALQTKGKEDEEKVVLDAKAAAKREEILTKEHSTVVLCLGDKVLREVAKESTAAGILEKLESLYMTKSLANRLLMKQRVYGYRFLEDKGVIEQLEDFSKAIDDLENIDVTISDEDKAILLLNALPKSYDQLRDAIMYGREGTITLAEVESALRAKELQKGASKPQDSATESLNIKKFKGKKGFKKDSDTFKPSSSDQKETRSCHWCKKPGHLKRDCFAWKRKQASEKEQGKNTTDCVQENEPPQILNVMQSGDRSSWILDSGCSLHMCPNAHWFEEISEASGSVVLGNNQVCRIEGIGSIRLRMDDNSVKIISEVRYIPDIKRNLISLGLLEKKGCTFESGGGEMLIEKDGNILMKGERKGTLYYLNATVIRAGCDEVNIAKTESLRTWHMRLGHPAYGSIRELVKKEVIPVADVSGQAQCEECVLAKSKKLPILKVNTLH